MWQILQKAYAMLSNLGKPKGVSSFPITTSLHMRANHDGGWWVPQNSGTHMCLTAWRTIPYRTVWLHTTCPPESREERSLQLFWACGTLFPAKGKNRPSHWFFHTIGNCFCWADNRFLAGKRKWVGPWENFPHPSSCCDLPAKNYFSVFKTAQ